MATMIWTRRLCWVLFCFIGYLALVTYRMIRMKSTDLYHPPPLRTFLNPVTNPHTTVNDELMKLLDWPEPPTTVSNISLSTHPKKSTFHLLDNQTTFKVGETLRVLITAKDHNGYPKTYGGDFFEAKLHSPKYKAGVTGNVKDFGNGSYLAAFLLPWPGEVAVNIKLIVSSEAVAVLKDKRENHPEKVTMGQPWKGIDMSFEPVSCLLLLIRLKCDGCTNQCLPSGTQVPPRTEKYELFNLVGWVHFKGFFQLNGVTEVTECNVELGRSDVCTYSHPISGDTWQCVRPQKLPCDAWVSHSTGGFRNVTSLVESYLLSGGSRSAAGSCDVRNVTRLDSCVSLAVEETVDAHEQQVPSALTAIFAYFDLLLFLIELISKLPVCRPGQEPPQTSGYYYNDNWASLTCQGQHFPHPSNASDCLRGKNIYMFGDSTLRQWFEYLERFIPSLKRIDLHVNYLPGPLLAVDPEFGLLLTFRSHGLPYRTTRTMASDFHYESVDIAGISGGPHTVVVITVWAHFTSFPIRFYIRRLAQVRKAVVSLLSSSPQTTVIIKTANTGETSVYTSDWLAFQLDILMRAAFKGLPIAMIDAWDMTSCHYSFKNIHPGQQVIRNEVDLMLSYICPR
ncbi:NXPE family member 3-like [Spea bombifrons]|uniref:NXPE family member 3-like n=1 Tax=Spea bombifrons TaxID=233779 RepID=UPI00234B055F|nr:NXPE family member 3-like [Spea bombifrons]